MTEVLQSLELHPVRIPMRHRFRRVDHREAVLIEGPTGWGEFSPFADYPPEVTTRWLACALEAACTVLPEPGRDSVKVNVTVPAVDPDLAGRIVTESGATTAKVKVGESGQDAAQDAARLRMVREVLGPEGRIRIDVNAAWDLDTAATRITSLEEFGLEYVEQPVATIEDMVALRGMVRTPIAADELVRMSSDPLQVVESGGADLLVLKTQPMGGISRVVSLAERAGVPVVISSALETSIGLYSGLLAATLIPESPYAFGLGTVSLIDGDPTPDPLLPRSGVLEVRRPVPDPDLLARWRPDRDRSAEMLRKVRAAAEVLT
jgi:O-succinylbenzoate synthase